MQNFEFFNPTKIVFGNKTIAKLAELVPAEARVLILYGGASARKNGTLDEVKAALGGRTLFEFGGIEANPTFETLMRAVDVVRAEKIDFLLAVGGGSVLDAAKAVALLVTNPDSTLAEMSETSVLQPRLPLIAIPTTAGTGSETTNVTVIIDAVSGRKQVLAHASLMPDVAILDAALTESVPPHITAMTGIDALTHAVEAYSARHATPFTDSLAMGAIAMIGEALPKAVGCGQDLAARENMLLASCMAGMAFSSAGLGLCHAMAHQPGAALHIPHGLANALLICNVIRYNANDNPTKQTAFSQYDRPQARRRYAEIADHLGLSAPGDRTAAKIEKLLAWLESVKAELGIPKSIREAGVQEADFLAHVDKLSEDAFDDQCTGANPRYPLISELKQILLDTYYGREFKEGDVAAVKTEAPAIKTDKKAKKSA